MLILRLSLIVLLTSLLECLVVNDNVNHVYLMMSFSMTCSLLLQVSSRQFLVSLALLVKKAKEIIETNLRGCKFTDFVTLCNDVVKYNKILHFTPKLSF